MKTPKFKSNIAWHHCQLVLVFSATLLAGAGCGSGSYGLASSDQSATPSLGAVINATVNFYAADGTTLLGSADTGDSGKVSVPISGYSGPVVVEIVGDADAEYFDEQSGTLQSFPAGQKLRAIAPVAGGEIGVTPLTELAYQTAVARQSFPLSGNVVRQFNDEVRAALAPGLTSILSVPATFDANTTSGSLQNTEGGRYALTLAALAGLGDGQPAPALNVLNALVEDLADGVIDSQANGAPITTPYSDFITELSSELASFAVNFGTSELQQQVSNLEPTSTRVSEEDSTGGSQPNGDTASATVHANLVGDYLLDYEQSATGGPFTDGETVMAMVTSASELKIAGKTLSDPFFRSANTAEVIWLDGSSNIEYALSNNDSGTFNEINVGDASNPQSTGGIPGFLGQLTEQETNNGTAPSQIVALAGSYDLDVVAKNGNFRSAYALNESVSVVISDAGLVTVDGQYTFDSSASDYFFSDESASFIPRYEVLADNAAGDRQTLRIYLDDQNPVAWQYQVTPTGSTDSIDLEVRPLPADLSAAADDLNGLSPISLTAVLDDSNYSSGYVLCEQITLSLQDDAEFDDSNRDIRFGYEIKGETGLRADGEIFDQQRGRYREANGQKILTFSRNRIVQGASGLIELESVDFRGDVKDSASNDPDAIAAAGCANEATDPEEGNQGKTRVSGDGFTGDIDGTVYTYEGSVELLPNNNDDGVLRIEGTDPNDITSKWRVFLPDEIGTYDCDDDGTPTVLEHLNQGAQGVDSGVGSGSGSCRVKLVQAGPIYEGYFTGSFLPSSGQTQLTVTDGYFILDTSAGGNDNNELPDGDNVAVVSVDDVTGVQRTGAGNPATVAKGDVFQLTKSPGFSDNSSSSHGTIWPEEDSGQGVFLQLVRMQKFVGSKDCGVGFAFPGMTFNNVYNNNTSDSSCTITVDSIADGVYRGSFQAVLAHSQEGDSFVTISGRFRALDPDA